MRTGQNIYVIDDEKLKKSRPDIIIAQGTCDVCAPSAKRNSSCRHHFRI